MAAGKGTRMKSALPKVLHQLAGRALLQHVIDTAGALQARKVVVITGHGAIEVEAACARYTGAEGTFGLEFVRQEPQLGTGHAVQQAVPASAAVAAGVRSLGEDPSGKTSSKGIIVRTH